MKSLQGRAGLYLIVFCIGIALLVQVNGRAAKFGTRHPYDYRPRSGTGGTYSIFDHGKPIYIGQSKDNVRGRLNAHMGGYDGQSVGRALSRMSDSYKEKYLQVAMKPGYENERSSIMEAKSRGFKLYNKNNGINGK